MRLLIGLLALALTGCLETGGGGGGAPAVDMADEPGRPRERRAAFTLRVPVETLDASARAHAIACRPPDCEVTLLSTDLADPRAARARLEARVAPAALAAFTARLAADGRIVAARESVEDLTAPTRDAEARLTAQRALRERLTRTLAERTAMPLDDLLGWERELARVQAEIEAAESTLRALSGRAAMVGVAVAYERARGLWLPEGAAPIEDALRDGLALSVESFAEAIRFLLIALPWVPILLLLWLALGWAFRRGRGRRGVR